jgi:hypothetical protein
MDKYEKLVKPYLTSLAVNGYCVISGDPYKNKICEVLSRHKIASVVRPSGTMIGVPDEIFKGILFIVAIERFSY